MIHPSKPQAPDHFPDSSSDLYCDDASGSMLGKRNHGNRAKTWFVTLPQCGDLSKEDYLFEIRQRYNVVEYVVAEERHETGERHLHAYFKLAKRISFGPNIFDYQLLYRGNYQVPRGVKQVIEYITKDKNFISNFDVQAYMLRGSKNVDLDKVLSGSMSVNEWVRQDSSRIYNLSKLITGLSLLKIHEDRTQLSYCEHSIPNPWCLHLQIFPRTWKQRHYWVWSTGPNYGKTTWLKDLYSKFKCSWYSTKESFQSDITKDSQFVLLDEYSGGKHALLATSLNQMCDGTYQYPYKGSSAITLNDPVIIITGNRNPAEIYPMTYKFLEARFNIYNLDALVKPFEPQLPQETINQLIDLQPQRPRPPPEVFSTSSEFIPSINDPFVTPKLKRTHAQSFDFTPFTD